MKIWPRRFGSLWGEVECSHWFTPDEDSRYSACPYWEIAIRFPAALEIGIVRELWGYRILLIRWHYIIHFKDRRSAR